MTIDKPNAPTEPPRPRLPANWKTSRSPWGYDDESCAQCLTQLVIERANLLSPFGHGVTPRL